MLGAIYFHHNALDSSVDSSVLQQHPLWAQGLDSEPPRSCLESSTDPRVKAHAETISPLRSLAPDQKPLCAFSGLIRGNCKSFFVTDLKGECYPPPTKSGT